MPRKPRFYLPGIPAHVVQRGNNREAIFCEERDYLAYLNWLKEGIERYGCALHAYVLMTNHVHLLISPKEKDSISLLMQFVGRYYVPYFNYVYGRSGTLWEGRHKGNLVQDDRYFLTCMRYIELNPVRANMVKSSKDYPWSSYLSNAFNKHNELITEHECYLSLGKNENNRMLSYRGLFDQHIDDEMNNEIRLAWKSGTPLGNDQFCKRIEAALQMKVGNAYRGRPLRPKNNAGN